ncbi:respiratory nitrate reductase subunit gamma [Streptomyces sp. NPDC004752]
MQNERKTRCPAPRTGEDWPPTARELLTRRGVFADGRAVFTAEDIDVVIAVLTQLTALRSYMRERVLGETGDERPLKVVVPLLFRLHVLTACLLFAARPATRLGHVWSLPIGCLVRPYPVYRRRAAPAAARAAAHRTRSVFGVRHAA